MATETAIQEPEPAQLTIPAYMIYETLNGKPLYRKGYKEVLAKQKTPGEIIGCSDIQAIIVSTLYAYLYNKSNRKAYWIVTNEPGLHIQLGDNLSNDIAFYEKDKVTVKGKFFDVAPKVVVEVDIKVDLDAFSAKAQDYVNQKTQAMLDFGTERVIWITFNWDATIPVLDDVTIPVLDDVTLNVAAVLTEEGVL